VLRVPKLISRPFLRNNCIISQFIHSRRTNYITSLLSQTPSCQHLRLLFCFSCVKMVKVQDLQSALDRVFIELKEMKESQLEFEKKLTNKIDNLEKLLITKDKKIQELETRIDDLEQYSRKEDLIITGLDIVIKKTFAEAVENDDESATAEKNKEPTMKENEVETQTIAFLNKFGMNVQESEVSACHFLGKKRDDGKRNVIIRFVSRKTKERVLFYARTSKKMRETKVFVNEHLTKKNGQIAKRARELKKEGKLIDTWVRDTKVFIKIGEKQVRVVKSIDELSQF